LATAVLFLCAAGTRSSRIGGFPVLDEPLDEGGLRATERSSIEPRFQASVAVSPMLAAI
jgi:hypothetical protein